MLWGCSGWGTRHGSSGTWVECWEQAGLQVQGELKVGFQAGDEDWFSGRSLLWAFSEVRGVIWMVMLYGVTFHSTSARAAFTHSHTGRLVLVFGGTCSNTSVEFHTLTGTGLQELSWTEDWASIFLFFTGTSLTSGILLVLVEAEKLSMKSGDINAEMETDILPCSGLWDATLKPSFLCNIFCKQTQVMYRARSLAWELNSTKTSKNTIQVVSKLVPRSPAFYFLWFNLFFNVFFKQLESFYTHRIPLSSLLRVPSCSLREASQNYGHRPTLQMTTFHLQAAQNTIYDSLVYSRVHTNTCFSG